MPLRLNQMLVLVDFIIDDLFEEDDSKGKKPAKGGEEGESVASKRKYLEQKWELSDEDAREARDYAKRKESIENAVDGVVPNYPCFALLYLFRREFFDANIEATLADHVQYGQKFKRLLNSEPLRLMGTRGVSLLFVGLTEDDKADTKDEVMRFMENDPLLLKDMIDRWDIIDLEASADAAGDKALPGEKALTN